MVVKLPIQIVRSYNPMIPNVESDLTRCWNRQLLEIVPESDQDHIQS